MAKTKQPLGSSGTPSWGVIAEHYDIIEGVDRSNDDALSTKLEQFIQVYRYKGKRYQVTFPDDWPECNGEPYVEEIKGNKPEALGV